MKLIEMNVDLSLLPEKDYFDIEFYNKFVKPQVHSMEIMNDLGIMLRMKGNWWYWHHIIGFVFFVIGIFSKSTKYRFYNDFYTMFINVIYVPKTKVSIFNFLAQMKDELETGKTDILRIIVHESQHRFDYLRDSFNFLKNYCFKDGRGLLEKRGYFWNIYFSVKENSYLDDRTKFIVKRALTGSMYLWMMDIEEAESFCKDAESFAKMLIASERG